MVKLGTGRWFPVLSVYQNLLMINSYNIKQRNPSFPQNHRQIVLQKLAAEQGGAGPSLLDHLKAMESEDEKRIEDPSANNMG